MAQQKKQLYPDLPDPWTDQKSNQTFAPVIDLVQFRKKSKTKTEKKLKSKVNRFVPCPQQLELKIETGSNTDGCRNLDKNIPTLTVTPKRRNFIKEVLNLDPPKRTKGSRGRFICEGVNCREKTSESGKTYLSWYYSYRCPNQKRYSIYIPKTMERLIALMENNNEMVIKILQILGAKLK